MVAGLLAASLVSLTQSASMSALSVSHPRVLAFSKTAGFRHDSIPDAQEALRRLSQSKGFTVTFIEDSAAFNPSNLANFDCVVFLLTTGDVLDETQQAAFQAFIREGNGYVGVHAATDTEYQWPWYRQLAGAYFRRHPQISKATIRIEDDRHPSTQFLPKAWERTDEWYDFDASPRKDVRVLASVDETTYAGGSMGSDHPIIWCSEFDGGRSWYTALGHTKESYTEPEFVEHLYQGILWASQAGRPHGAESANFGATLPKGWIEVGDVLLDTSDPLRLTSSPGSGVLFTSNGRDAHLITREQYGDVLLHVEFCIPKNSNSGVYLMGRYEIQIRDSFEVAAANLMHSDMGGKYERWKNDKGFDGVPPRVNAALAPGKWQTLDIRFSAPRFDRAGKKISDAVFHEVRLNGLVVLENVRCTGPTRASLFDDEKPKGPLMLQGDHGPIAYRNVWVLPRND